MSRIPTDAEVLEIGWQAMAREVRRDPWLAGRLLILMRHSMVDPHALGDLDRDEALMVARLAHLGLGEALIRAVKAGPSSRPGVEPPRPAPG